MAIDLPEGFQLDQPQNNGLPEGFQLDEHPNNVKPQMGRGEAAFITATNPLNFGDEIKASIAALTAKIMGGASTKDIDIGDLYREARTNERTKLEQAKKTYPIQSAIIGGASDLPLEAGIIGKMGLGGASIPKLATAGGALGTLGGAGASEADTMGGVTKDALTSGVVGAVAAPIVASVAPKVVDIIGKGATSIKRMFTKTTGEQVANEAIPVDVAKRGLTKLSNAPEGKPTTALDIQEPQLQTFLRSVVNPYPQAKQIAKDFVEGRNKEAYTRINEDLKSLSKTENADDYINHLSNVQKEVASPLYAEAEADRTIVPRFEFKEVKTTTSPKTITVSEGVKSFKTDAATKTKTDFINKYKLQGKSRDIERPLVSKEEKELFKQAQGSLASNKETVEPLSVAKRNLAPLDSLNPTGSLYAKYNPQDRMSAPLANNISTYDKTAGISSDEIITIFRGAPKNQKTISEGDFITTNYNLAKDYAGSGHILKKEVKASDILDDLNEPLGEEYIYRPLKKTAPTNNLVSQEEKELFKQATGSFKASKDAYDLYHGTPANLIGNSLAFGRGDIKKGGTSGGLFLTDDPEIAKVFSFGGRVYRASSKIKDKVLDLTDSKNIQLFKEHIGKKYQSDGEDLIFTKQDFDYMFPDGKVDYATLNADLAEQIAESKGKIGVAFDEYAGGRIGKTYQIFKGEIPVKTEEELANLRKITPKTSKTGVAGIKTGSSYDKRDLSKKGIEEFQNTLRKQTTKIEEGGKMVNIRKDITNLHEMSPKSIELAKQLDELENNQVFQETRNKAKQFLNPDALDNSIETLHATREMFDDKISVAIRNGQNKEVRRLSILRSKVDNIIGKVSPVFKQADEAFKPLAIKKEAVEFGKEFTKYKPTEINQKINELTSKSGLNKNEILEDARVGVKDFILKETEKAIKFEGSNIPTEIQIKEIIKNKFKRDQLKTFFPASEDYSKFINNLNQEVLYNKTIKNLNLTKDEIKQNSNNFVRNAFASLVSVYTTGFGKSRLSIDTAKVGEAILIKNYKGLNDKTAQELSRIFIDRNASIKMLKNIVDRADKTQKPVIQKAIDDIYPAILAGHIGSKTTEK